MLMPSLIPVLLVDRSLCIAKSVSFGDQAYISDPLNIIRLFNEKQVDEICVLDIDATADARKLDIAIVASLAAECFMPLSYGGGIATLQRAHRLIADGRVAR